MDPEYSQLQPDENPPPNSTALDSTTSNISDDQPQQQSDLLLPNYFRDPSAPNNNRLLNDANLILNRRISCNQKIKRSLELICEDKISRYKLEEVHCSLPSSIKSTFIMTFSPDGRKVASTHGDHRIYICDLNTGKLLDTLDGHSKTPWCLAWHPINKEILASGCLAGEVRVWDLRSKACETWNSENNTIITSLDFHPRERILVIASANDIHFWDWSESRPFAKTTTTHDKEKVKFVEFDPSGTKLVTGISNLPKYAGYSSDSLQTRIIDSYLTQGTLDQLPAENMTQNSEITSPLSGALNTNDTFNERNLYSPAPSRRQPIGGTNNNDLDAYRSTVTLSRVASLYRQLEALEDSMRHTSFSPYMDPTRPIGSASIEPSDRQSNSETANDNDGSVADHQNLTNNPPDIDQPSSQLGRTERLPTAFEPFVVSFDESLENLQLLPLTVDGQTVNLATLIEHYPIDLPYQLHYVMQFESINQVNQNFIRISKLMSSVRLYRQVVQQILSGSAGQGHYQANQVLTAQSASPRSSRLSSNLPIVFRNFPMGNTLDANNRLARSSDPIMAIQFRNSARNVPLVTICKIDLLSARSVCISRSQQLIEQALSSFRSFAVGQSSSADATFYPLLNQLHQSLTDINHAPLTTSNVHIHISSLRSLINALLTTLSSLTSTQEEGLRQVRLIHDIAHSLTGRSWNIPLGANLDDIRLDVIHTLCIVDLTLHLTRQVQLLQMQRLSAMARIEESRRANTSSSSNTGAQTSTSDPTAEQTETVQGPSTSHVSLNTTNTLSSKRKDPEATTSFEDASKRRRVENERVGTDIEMIEAHNPRLTDSIESSSVSSNSPPATAANVNNQFSSPVSNSLGGLSADAAPGDRLILWNGTQNSLDQGLQRFLVATAASSMSNSHILVRIYHRLHGHHLTLSNMPPNSMLDQSNTHSDRPNHPPLESRRRALSQDNSSAAGPQESQSPPRAADNPRGLRQFQVNFLPTSGNSINSNSAPHENLPRHPHFHVYQGRSAGQHLWFNQWTIPLPVSNLNFRLQCWDFSASALPNIKDSQSNIVTQKCRIHNDASIDISNDGTLVACLVPRDDVACLPSFDLKVFSLRTIDFGACYYQLPHGPNAISVSLSPTASHAVVGLATNKFISSDPNEDDLTIAKVSKLKGRQPFGFVRDVKIKRDDSTLSLNAIRWMERGIVYNVGPQHHQRYTARMRNRVV